MIAGSVVRLVAGLIAFLIVAPRLAAAGEQDLQALLGPEKRVRDSVDFTTEKGERGTLVLFVTNVQSFPGDQIEIEPPLSCGNQVPGIPLTAVYHVALILGGALVNEITIPPPDGAADGAMALPMRNLPYYNYQHWGQGTAVEYDPGARHTEPTKLLRLADFNGDGHAWEFRLLQSGVCGHFSTLAAGYSAARRAVIVHSILSGPFRSDWADNFFAHPTKGNGTRIETIFPCGDHGNEDREVWQEYLFDAAREVWVLNRHRERDCKPPVQGGEEPAEVSGSPIELAVGSAEGSPGERVSIEVSLDTGETPVGRVAHAIVVDPRVSVAAIDGLDFARENQWVEAEDGVGPIHCASELVSSCEWAFHIRLDGRMLGRSVLYALKLTIPADAAPGSYPLRNTDLVARDESGRRLRVDGTDGALRVRARDR